MRRAMSLLEVVFSTILLSGAVLLMSSAIRLGFAWNATARDTLATTTRLDALQTHLHRALRRGRPVPRLVITRSGELRETPAPDAAVVWEGPHALILRGESGYTVLVPEDERVVEYFVAGDGHVTSRDALREVRLAEFDVVWAADDDPRGVTYRVAFSTGGPELEGFVGIRVPGEGLPPTPRRPQPAPRYNRPGGDR